MSDKLFEEIDDAYEAVRDKPGVNRIEGEGIALRWKVYRVTGGIIRIDIQPKEKHGH